MHNPPLRASVGRAKIITGFFVVPCGKDLPNVDNQKHTDTNTTAIAISFTDDWQPATCCHHDNAIHNEHSTYGVQCLADEPHWSLRSIFDHIPLGGRQKGAQNRFS